MDQDLVVRAQQGDQRAFEMLAADAYTRLFRLAHGILRDGAKADDATQQALVSIWRSLPGLRDPARFEGWCCRLLVKPAMTRCGVRRGGPPRLPCRAARSRWRSTPSPRSPNAMRWSVR